MFVAVVDALGTRHREARYRRSNQSFRLPEMTVADAVAVEITVAGFETVVVPLGSSTREQQPTIDVSMKRRHHDPLVIDVRSELQHARAVARRAYADQRVAESLAEGHIGELEAISGFGASGDELSLATRLLAALIADQRTIDTLVEPDAAAVCPSWARELVVEQLDATWVIPADSWGDLACVIAARRRFYAIAEATLCVPLVARMTLDVSEAERRLQLSRVLASADFPVLRTVVALMTRSTRPDLVPVDAFGRALLRTLPVNVPEGYFARRRAGHAYPSNPANHTQYQRLVESPASKHRLDDAEKASFSLASLAAILDDAFNSLTDRDAL